MTGIGLPRFPILSILSIHVNTYPCQGQGVRPAPWLTGVESLPSQHSNGLTMWYGKPERGCAPQPRTWNDSQRSGDASRTPHDRTGL